MATRGFKMQSKKYKPYICYSDDYNVINESFDPTYDFGCGYSYTKISKKLLKNLYLHQLRRNFSLVARCSLKFTRCSLLVVKSLVTRCKIRSLLVAKNHSLLVAKFARYSLQKLLVAKNHLLLVAKFARYSLQKLLVAKNHSLLVAKLARYSLQKLLVAKNHLLIVAKLACYSLQLFIETTQIK